MPWDPPPERIRELLREGAELVLQRQSEWLDEFARASLGAAGMEATVSDPVLAAESARAARATVLRWAAANIRDPGVPVAVSLDPDTVGIARDLIRRGLDESALAAYRIGQAAAWKQWLEIAFSLTAEPDELRALLEVSSQSISEFVEETLKVVTNRMRAEREELLKGTDPERREVIALLLEGAPIPRERAESRLGYNLAQLHTAVVVWSMEHESELDQLEQSVELVIKSARSRSPLTVVPGAATVWVWLPGMVTIDVPTLTREIAQIQGVRVAIGSAAFGPEGFRRSHMDALLTQRMLSRLGSPHRVATVDDVRLVSLVTTDRDRSEEFVRQALGNFATAGTQLRETVLIFVQEQGSVARTAARLFAHRNTVVRRLARADELLPKPLEANPIHVAVALEVLQWQGDGQ